MKFLNFLSGTRTIHSLNSKYNGEIKVIRDVTWGTYIQVGGLTQSGGIVKNIWKKTLKYVLEKKPVIENCLILGLGGGSVADVVSSYWVGAKIVGVDIDGEIVDMGKKYLNLDTTKIEVKIEDAFEFVKKEKRQYDLILIDLYSGDTYPQEFESDEFLINIKRLLIFDGTIIFNRLYGTNNRSKSMKFGRKLEKEFRKVDYIFPQANVELICYN